MMLSFLCVFTLWVIFFISFKDFVIAHVYNNVICVDYVCLNHLKDDMMVRRPVSVSFLKDPSMKPL